MKLDISKKGITSLETFLKLDINTDEIFYLNCSNNALTNLVGCPKNVKTLVCNSNRITSLEGCPPNVEILSCSNNNITSLAECPRNLMVLDCTSNLVTSLQGLPTSLEYLHASWNTITTLEGCPQNLKKLSCNYNKLTTLHGCPQTLTSLDCGYNELTTLEGCPLQIIENPMTFFFAGNPLLPEWNIPQEEIKNKLLTLNFKRGIDIVNNVTQWKWRLIRRFCDNLLHKWYAPDENGIAPYAVWTYRKFQQECAV